MHEEQRPDEAKVIVDAETAKRIREVAPVLEKLAKQPSIWRQAWTMIRSWFRGSK
jgi:hypothetical protein